MSEPKSRIVINRVYTRTGDQGDTALASGERVGKDHPRIEAYGTVDELNATIGTVVCLVRTASQPVRERLLDELLRIQQELFDLGSELAFAEGKLFEGLPVVDAAAATAMEELMDRCNQDLEPLRSFVLPGSGALNAALHVGRTVCRRAERDLLRLSRQEAVRPEALKYLNRLSDLLFVLSRWASHQAGEAETLWQQKKDRPRVGPVPDNSSKEATP